MTKQEAIDILRETLNRTQLFSDDFPHGPVTISLLDGSFICFFDAFHIYHEESVYLFTEHYGYHEFERELVTVSSGPRIPIKRRGKK